MAEIGKNVIENLTTAMYENSYIIYREYIQNAADSIDKAISKGIIAKDEACIDIDIEYSKRKICIYDNAFGLGKHQFYMPETMIIYRLYFEDNGLVDKWWKCFKNLSNDKLELVKPIIWKNDFTKIEQLTDDNELLELLNYYTIKREDAERQMNK